MTKTISFLSAVLLVGPVTSWSLTFEPLKGALGRSSVRWTTLRASENDDGDADELAAFRARLDISFSLFDGNGNNPLGAFSRTKESNANVDMFKQSLDRVFDIDVAAYAGNVLDLEDVCEGELCGLDDEECEIPEDFKLLPDENSVNVMDFLGIRRAEPLKVRGRDDWQ